MHEIFHIPAQPLIVFTDLDGTLLDHDSYDFTPALPALNRLKSLLVPVVPVTSKTLAELQVLTGQLRLQGPVVAENGGVIAIPDGYFEAEPPAHANEQGYLVELLSPAYERIVDDLARLRQMHGFRFEGFSDLSADAVTALTGLGREDAQRARQRMCSEPLVWHDSEAAFSRFQSALTELGYNLVRGGRFHHVLGQTDKARAIKTLLERYARAGLHDVTTIGLGDSPNDLQMLAAVSVPVAIRRKDGGWLEHDIPNTIINTHATGPEGWNEAIQQYLDRHEAGGTERTQHG